MIGQLSQAQLDYAALLSAQTGLAPSVVTTWIGRESGWGTTNASNNYLNLGPGYTYASVSQGATAAADLINTSPLYQGIAASSSASPSTQIAAIQASPWDKSHYGGTLTADYQDVVSSVPGGSANATTSSWWKDLEKIGLGIVVPGDLGGVASGASGLAKSAAGAVAGAVVNSSAWQKVLLTVVLVAAGCGLIVLGISRMFPGITRTITSTVGAAGAAA